MRPIDADEAKRFAAECWPNPVYRLAIDGLLDSCPTIDPKDLQPRGHWIVHHSGGLICSHCNHYIASEWRSPCCPTCGAKLDGEVKYDGR